MAGIFGLSFGKDTKKSSSSAVQSGTSSGSAASRELKLLSDIGITTGSGVQTERYNLDQNAIDKMIQDVLGGADGLASIFSGEKNAGIFDSSVAAQAAGNLAANLVGELAKLTSERVATSRETSKNKQDQLSGGQTFADEEQEFQQQEQTKGKTTGTSFGFSFGSAGKGS